MTKWQKWLHTYYLWYTPTQLRNGVWNGGMVDWREWSNGGNGGNGRNGRTAERMAEQKWLYKCLGLILGVFPSDLVCDLSLFWEMLLVLVFNTFLREWPNGRKNVRMAEWQKWIHTYYLWYTPTPMTPTIPTTPTTLNSFIL
jgi:hypothetical protein